MVLVNFLLSNNLKNFRW